MKYLHFFLYFILNVNAQEIIETSLSDKHHPVMASINDSDRKGNKPYVDIPFADSRLKICENYLVNSKLFLRPIFPNDYTYFAPIYTDKEYIKYFERGQIMSIDSIKELTYARAQNNRVKNPRSYHWTIITYGGIAGIVSINYPHENEKMTELYYCIAPGFGGRGLATDASLLITTYVSGPFVATAHPDNIPSRAVLSKIGFKPDPRRQNVPKFNSIRDYYVLTK